ncbi:hypothetical protein Tco_0421680 [Tanacetum coccineum]
MLLEAPFVGHCELGVTFAGLAIEAVGRAVNIGPVGQAELGLQQPNEPVVAVNIGLDMETGPQMQWG